MSQSVYFNGDTLTVPGVYSAIDTSAVSTKSNTTGVETIALLGECTGGEPGAVQFFSEPTVARKVLKSGELLKACEKAWNPVSSSKSGVALGGANVIACIRTNAATKSKYTVAKTVESVEKNQVVFQSKDWGGNVNYQIKMGDGTLSGTKAITVYDQVNQVYENIDNIGNCFTINYVGTAAYAELNVFVDGNHAMYLQTKVGADASSAQEDLKIKLDTTIYKSMKALINELKAYENYVVSASNQYNYKLAVTDLDLVTAASIKLTEATAYRVTAVYADMKYKMETDSQLVEVASFDKTLGDIANFAYVNMTGGTEGLSPASWITFFDSLSNYDISYIVPLTPDASIHTELQSHITEMSGSLGRERRGVIGGNVGETVNATLLRANQMSSSRMQVVHGGFYDINANNSLELYPPYILAAQHAGRAARLEGGESATHDVYRMSAPEYKLERSEITQLINGGCLAFEFVLGRNSTSQSFVRLVQDLTTDTVNTYSVYTERATGALADSINKELRWELEDLLTGKRTVLADLTSAQNRVISVLANRKRQGHIIDYADVYVSKDGTVMEIDYSIAPAEPNNFTLITAHYYSESLTTEGTE